MYLTPPRALWVLTLLALLAPCLAGATAIAAINDARRTLCAPPGTLTALTEAPSLDALAGRLAGGATLHDAVAALDARPGYVADARLVGALSDEEIRRAVTRGYCRVLARQDLRQIGVARRGATVWVVVAAPFTSPRTTDAERVADVALKLVNEARSRPRRCGATHFSPSPPVSLADALSAVAQAHAQTMADDDVLRHEAADSRTAAERVRRAGLAARHVGENIASGVPTAAEVVAGWLASPGHCEVIMDPRFTAMGLGYALAPRSRGVLYWTQLFTEPPPARVRVASTDPVATGVRSSGKDHTPW